MLPQITPLDEWQRSPTAPEDWLVLGSGALLMLYGATRRSPSWALVAAAGAPLVYRGITGQWPSFLARLTPCEDTKAALSGAKGLHVREAIRVELPIEDVYRFWRRLENLPRFMSHLHSVTEYPSGRSHWVAAGPAGLQVEWDAEIINEVENQILAWRSLPGS